MFAFTLKNKAGETESWHIDLKNKGEVGKGLGDKPTGETPCIIGVDEVACVKICRFCCISSASLPPSLLISFLASLLTYLLTVTLSLSDDDFGKLVAGKANAQRLFMAGKLKVKGDVMKATKMEPILKKAQGVKAKL